MVVWIHGHAIQAAPNHPTTGLQHLLCTVMARLAKRLPVLSIPKQLQVTFVRLNVVNNRGWNHTTKVHVHLAKRMLTQEHQPGLLPLVAIPSLSA